MTSTLLPSPDFHLPSLIAVLMGGFSTERDVSLTSGAAVSKAFRELGANVIDIDVQSPDFKLPPNVGLAINMIHGTFGEDGELQAILDSQGVAYTGEGADVSRLAFDKIATKKRFCEYVVPTAEWEIVTAGKTPTLDLPYVMKPVRQGSSVGVHIISDCSQVSAALADCLKFDHEVIVERFVSGRELTVGILGQQALPIVEIVPHDGFYGYDSKYTKGATDYFVPARLTPRETEAVTKAALDAAKALGLEVYGRVDVILSDTGIPAVLEINTIPGMTPTSLLPKAAAAVGVPFPQLCLKIAELSLTRHKNQ